jgi:hypothetical protein
LGDGVEKLEVFVSCVFLAYFLMVALMVFGDCGDELELDTTMVLDFLLWIRGTMHWRTLGIKKTGDVGVPVFVWGGEQKSKVS